MKRKRGKIWLCGVATMVSCLMLAGCGHEHTWVDATCTEPKTCSECGETEGEALGHVWVDATCSAPKTCSVCGETEGEALEHTLTEANYQQPATCEICGETVGDVLTPAFEEYKVKGQFMELGKTYDFVTICADDTNYKTVGQATVADYQTFTSDDAHEAKEGYEWKTVTLQIAFSDENVQKYGLSYGWRFENYYDIIGFDDSATLDDNGVGTFTVNWNGQDYTECKFIYKEGDDSGWKDHILSITAVYEYLIPTGYDGMIAGLYDYSIPEEEGKHIYDLANDDTLFFRLD